MAMVDRELCFCGAGAVFNLICTDRDRTLMEKIERHFAHQVPKVYNHPPPLPLCFQPVRVSEGFLSATQEEDDLMTLLLGLLLLLLLGSLLLRFPTGGARRASRPPWKPPGCCDEMKGRGGRLSP